MTIDMGPKGLDPAVLPGRMTIGANTRPVKKGACPDLGPFRTYVWQGQRRIKLTCMAGATVPTAPRIKVRH
jgi:hypothetical protein